MKVVNLHDVAKTKVEMAGADKAWRQLVLGKEDGVPTFSLRVFTVEPGGHTPLHEHVSEHLNLRYFGGGGTCGAGRGEAHQSGGLCAGSAERAASLPKHLTGSGSGPALCRPEGV